MRADQIIDIDGHAVTIRELTVGDIRVWLKRIEPPATGEVGEVVDILGEVLIEGESLDDLMRMTSLTQADIDALSPSELRGLLARVMPVVREVNADFFAMRARLAGIGQAALAAAP